MAVVETPTIETLSVDGNVDGPTLAGRSNSFPGAPIRLAAKALAQLEEQNAYEQTEADDIR